MSVAAFRKRKADFQVYVDTLSSSWNGTSSLLGQIPYETFEIDLDEMIDIADKVNKLAKKTLVRADYIYHEKSDLIYKILISRASARSMRRMAWNCGAS